MIALGRGLFTDIIVPLQTDSGAHLQRPIPIATNAWHCFTVNSPANTKLSKIKNPVGETPATLTGSWVAVLTQTLVKISSARYLPRHQSAREQAVSAMLPGPC